jgi:hypothetical protein
MSIHAYDVYVGIPLRIERAVRGEPTGAAPPVRRARRASVQESGKEVTAS